MLKLTKTGIGLLTKQYRSVLKRCLIANLCILYPLTSWAISKTGVSPISGYNYIYEYIYDRYTTNSYAYNNLDINTSLSRTISYVHGSNFDLEQFVADVVGGEFSYTKAQTDALLNYYYTKTEADARYAKLSGGNVFTGIQDVESGGNARVRFYADGASGVIQAINKDGKRMVDLFSDSQVGRLHLYNSDGTPYTVLTTTGFALNGSSYASGIDFAANVTAGTTNASHLATTGAINQLLNYYYTFRVDERVEMIEFAKELRRNKKEMSSLDFIPIKSSSDLRINLIKAEDPLTFSAKTRDDSLVLMEV